MKRYNIEKIYIRRRTLPQWLAVYIAVMPFFLTFLQDFLGLPSLLKYTLDAAWVAIAAMVLSAPKASVRKQTLPLLLIAIGFFLHCFVVYGVRFQSPAYFLWGFRNNFRYYVAFFAFAAFLDSDDVESVFNLMTVLFWINAAVTMVQYFVMGYAWDYLGGIFGVELGCNANTLLFFCFYLTASVLRMMHDKSKTRSCMIHLLVSSVIAAMAELKVYFLMLAIILVLAILVTRFSWRKVILALMLVLCLSLGSTLLVLIFGESSNLSVENMLRLIFASSYSSHDDLGRLSAIPILSRTILTEPFERIAGLGLGNCDTSSFAICNTPFYQNYSYLNYTWFSSAFLFLETGFVGLALYVAFFAAVFLISAKLARKPGYNELYCQISMIMSVMCVILMIYNSSLRMEIGYLAYLSLALPFVRKAAGRPGRKQPEGALL